MFSKSTVKYIQSLQHKKFRDEEGLFVAEGPKLVGELLAGKVFACKNIYALPQWSDQLSYKQKTDLESKLVLIKDFELEKISSLSNPNLVLAVFEKKKPLASSLKGKISLVLDDIQDPGNLGTIIRIADWFGIENVICSLHTADMYNSKVVQSTMASLQRVNLIYTDVESLLIENKTIKKFGKIDILVNNAALHYEKQKLEDITSKQLLKTFSTNIFSYFWVTQAALPYMGRKASIINTASVTAYRGSDSLIDYASTKGAIVSFTRSLASNVVKKGIRVNGVAPGPIWTPLIPATFPRKKVANFGSDVPMERAGQPAEVAPSYLFLACDDSAYMTGQFLHPNGGEIVNG